MNNSKQKQGDAALANAATPLQSICVVGNRIDSREIFKLTREVLIEHGAETYRLRLTAQNKLILTK